MSRPVHPITGDPIQITNAGDPHNGQTMSVGDRASLKAMGLAEPEEAPQRTVRPAESRGPIAQPLRVNRPDWHKHRGAPLAVDEAWAEVQTLARAARRADGELQALGRDQDAEHRAATAAVLAGQDVPAGTDWAREETLRRAQASAAHQRYRLAREEYDDVVAAQLVPWIKGLAETLPELQANAREAVSALAAVSEWRSTVRAVLELERERDEARSIRNTQFLSAHAKRVTGTQIPAELTELVNSEDPVITASWVLQREATEPHSDPARPMRYPVHIRQAMNDDDNTVSFLAEMEASENFAVTAFTEDDWGQLFPTSAERGQGAAPAVLNDPQPRRA